MALVKQARDEGIVSGRFMQLGLQIEAVLADIKGKPVPMNIDGATAVIYAEFTVPGTGPRVVLPVPFSRGDGSWL